MRFIFKSLPILKSVIETLKRGKKNWFTLSLYDHYAGPHYMYIPYPGMHFWYTLIPYTLQYSNIIVLMAHPSWELLQVPQWSNKFHLKKLRQL